MRLKHEEKELCKILGRVPGKESHHLKTVHPKFCKITIFNPMLEKYEDCLDHLQKGLINLEKMLEEPSAAHGLPSLSLSLGLSLSARDLAIELGQLSIVA